MIKLDPGTVNILRAGRIGDSLRIDRDAVLTDRQFKAGRNAAIAKSPDRAAKPRRFSWEVTE